MECKSRKSRVTWSNRQIWPWSTKWSMVKTNRVLPREDIDYSKHPLPKTQEMTLHMDITWWSIPKSDYIFSSWRWRSSIQLAKTRPRADCGSDHELLIAKFRLKLKSRENHSTVQVWPKSNPLRLYSGSDKKIQRIRSDRVPEELWEVRDTI